MQDVQHVWGSIHSQGSHDLRTLEAVGFPKLMSLPKGSSLGSWTLFEGGGHCKQIHDEESDSEAVCLISILRQLVQARLDHVVAV